MIEPELIEAVRVALHVVVSNYPVAVEWAREAWPWLKPMVTTGVGAAGGWTWRRFVERWDRRRKWRRREQRRREKWERKQEEKERRSQERQEPARRTRKRGAKRKRRK